MLGYEKHGCFYLQTSKGKRHDATAACKAVSKWERGLACPDISILPQIAEILGVNVDDLLSNPTTDKWHAFKELNRNDVKEMLLLLCRCISLVLAVGGLIIYFMGKLTASDLGIIACVAVALLSIDSLCR